MNTAAAIAVQQLVGIVEFRTGYLVAIGQHMDIFLVRLALQGFNVFGCQATPAILCQQGILVHRQVRCTVVFGHFDHLQIVSPLCTASDFIIGAFCEKSRGHGVSNARK